MVPLVRIAVYRAAEKVQTQFMHGSHASRACVIGSSTYRRSMPFMALSPLPVARRMSITLAAKELCLTQSMVRLVYRHRRGQCCGEKRLGCGSGGTFEVCQPDHRLFTAGPAHVLRRLQASAKGRAFRLAENGAALVGAELDAPDAGRFSVRHARERAGDRRRRAAGTAVGAARKGGVHGPAV